MSHGLIEVEVQIELSGNSRQRFRWRHRYQARLRQAFRYRIWSSRNRGINQRRELIDEIRPGIAASDLLGGSAQLRP
jgi:hypothetical protein